MKVRRNEFREWRQLNITFQNVKSRYLLPLPFPAVYHIYIYIYCVCISQFKLWSSVCCLLFKLQVSVVLNVSHWMHISVLFIGSDIDFPH